MISASGRLLADALGLGGPLPDWRRIREKFNLEPGDAPIPPGIYLAQDGEEVTAVFVEGDLQKLELSAGDGWQAVAFLQNGLRSELRYQPGLASLAWSGPEAVAGRTFSEKIIVHGNIWDIGQAGAAAFLSASRLQVLACGQMVVRTQLEGENLELGKEKFPGLLLMTAGRDFFNDRRDSRRYRSRTAGRKDRPGSGAGRRARWSTAGDRCKSAAAFMPATFKMPGACRWTPWPAASLSTSTWSCPISSS